MKMIIDPDLENLIQLSNNIRIGSKIQNLRRLTEDLNLQFNPKKQWGWNYIHQIINHKLPLSKSIRVAIRRLTQENKTQPQWQLQKIMIIAPIGFVISGSLVTAKTKVCQRPGCGMRFVPSNSSQKYHSARCRKLANHK